MCVWTVFRFQLHVVLGMNYCSNSCLWIEEMTHVCLILWHLFVQIGHMWCGPTEMHGQNQVWLLSMNSLCERGIHALDAW